MIASIDRIAIVKKDFHKKKFSNFMYGEEKVIENRRGVVLYGSETSIVGIPEQRNIRAFEISSCRKMMKIRWMEKISNEEMLQCVRRKL